MDGVEAVQMEPERLMLHLFTVCVSMTSNKLYILFFQGQILLTKPYSDLTFCDYFWHISCSRFLSCANKCIAPMGRGDNPPPRVIDRSICVRNISVQVKYDILNFQNSHAQFYLFLCNFTLFIQQYTNNRKWSAVWFLSHISETEQSLVLRTLG